jgi:hypothetical protein
MYLRKKKVNGKVYFCVVKGERDFQGKVQQQTLHYLGEPRSALLKAQALGLPQGMIEKIKKSIPPSQKYMLFRMSEDGDFEGNWSLRLSGDEFESLWEKYIKNS